MYCIFLMGIRSSVSQPFIYYYYIDIFCTRISFRMVAKQNSEKDKVCVCERERDNVFKSVLQSMSMSLSMKSHTDKFEHYGLCKQVRIIYLIATI